MYSNTACGLSFPYMRNETISVAHRHSFRGGFEDFNPKNKLCPNGHPSGRIQQKIFFVTRKYPLHKSKSNKK